MAKRRISWDFIQWLLVDLPPRIFLHRGLEYVMYVAELMSLVGQRNGFKMSFLALAQVMFQAQDFIV